MSRSSSRVIWRGIGKVTEEAGEVLQLLGKTMVFPKGKHPDGKGRLRDRLPEEIADLRAALTYFEEANKLPRLRRRERRKLTLFRKWKLSGVKV